MEATRSYLPAAGRDLFLPLYDPMVKLLGGDKARRILVDQANLQPGQRVLEIGCGTGTLTTMIRRLYPDVQVTGLDPDPKALARANRKAAGNGLSIAYDLGFSDDLEYREQTFDKVFSALMLHHVPVSERAGLFSEAWRVLKPGGEIHLMDFDGPGDGAHGGLSRRFHANHHHGEISGVQVIELMRQGGFSEATKARRRKMIFGVVAYYRAARA